MTSTSVKINKNLFNQLQDFTYKKHKSFRCVKIELDEAVKEYLANQQDQEKEN